MLKMRRNIILIAVILNISMLIGCSPISKVNKSNENANEVRISVGTWPKETDKVATSIFEGYVKEMKTKYPNIIIEPDYWHYDVNSFLPKAASGQLPTIYETWFTEAGKIIDAGYAKDITNTITKYGYQDKINQNYMKLVTKDSKYYGLPNTGYVMGLACNVKLFKEAGLVDSDGFPIYPQTYEELAITAQKIKQKTGKAGYYIATTNNQGGWNFMNIAWSFGAEVIEKQNGKWVSTFNSPECIAALQYVKDLKWKYDAIQDDILGDVNTYTKMFSTNQAAMGMFTPGNFGATVTDYKADINNASLARLPAGPKNRTNLMGGTLKMFNNDATDEQIDAAFKWLEVTGFSPEVTDDMKAKWEEQCSANKQKGLIVGCEDISIWTDPKVDLAKAEIVNKYANVNLKLFNDYMGLKDTVIRPEIAVNAQELYKVFDSLIQEVLTNKNADVSKILSKAGTDFQLNYLDKVN